MHPRTHPSSYTVMSGERGGQPLSTLVSHSISSDLIHLVRALLTIPLPSPGGSTWLEHPCFHHNPVSMATI